LCDVRLHYAQGCVEQEDIDTSRRRRFRFTNATAIDVDVTGWQNVEAAASAQDALEKIDAALTAQALAGRAGFNAAQMTLRQVQEQQRQDADDVEQMRAANQEAHTRQTAEMGHLATWVKQSKEELRLEMTAARAMADNTGRRVADIETEINTLKRLLSPRPRRPVAKRLCDTYIYRETVRDANIQGPGYFYAEVDIPGLRRSDHVTVSLDEKNDREYLHVNYGFVRDDRLQIILRSDGGNVYRHVGYTVIVQAFE
jgi:predicted NAD-dependent protein-ADP-ribosyltransferase YbiA (DUF1768 family)